MSMHMKLATLLATLCSTAIVLTSCGPSTPARVDGNYRLAGDAFLDAAVESLRQSGRIPAGSEGMAKAQLRAISMMLRLDPQGGFSSTMKAMGQEQVFKGTWRREGDQLFLTQTHAGDEPKHDSMQGRIDGDVLRLTHMEQGLAFPYVLQRVGLAASPQR